MPFGGDADETASAQMYRAARDAGINFFDTADQYSKGRSEEILGALMRGHRDELIIATKCYSPSGSDINARGGSRRHIRRAVEASLKRLQTDRGEILYLHQYDALTPIEDQCFFQEFVFVEVKHCRRLLTTRMTGRAAARGGERQICRSLPLARSLPLPVR